MPRVHKCANTCERAEIVERVPRCKRVHSVNVDAGGMECANANAYACVCACMCDGGPRGNPRNHHSMSNSARDGAAATAAASCRRTVVKRGLRAMRSSRRTTAGHRVCLRPNAVANARTASHTIWRRQNGKCRDSGSCDEAEVFDDADAEDAAKDEKAEGPEDKDDDEDDDDGSERGVPCLLVAAARVGGDAIGDEPYRLAPRATLPLPKVAAEKEDCAKPLPKAGRAGDVMGSAVANAVDGDDGDNDDDDDEDDEDDKDEESADDD